MSEQPSSKQQIEHPVFTLALNCATREQLIETIRQLHDKLEQAQVRAADEPSAGQWETFFVPKTGERGVMGTGDDYKLTVTGPFQSVVEKRDYCERLAAQLNRTPLPPTDTRYEWLKRNISGREWRAMGIVYSEPSKIDALIDERLAATKTERLCGQCGKNFPPECRSPSCPSHETSVRNFSCVHHWTVIGRIGDPYPDAICEGGCGQTYAELQRIYEGPESEKDVQK